MPSIDLETQLEPHREALRLHCYRMTGSLLEAEDLAQETLIRAWEQRSAFRGEARVSTWLYRIATNLCLDFLRGRKRRVMALGADFPRYQMGEELPPPRSEVLWLEPYPDPLDSLVRRDQVSLAFLSLLQGLPPNQRAVLLVADVLGHSAQETATLLGLTTAAVNSALQRARKAVSGLSAPATVTSGREAVLDRFLAAWDAADADALVALMRDDTRMTMPPIPMWVRGRTDIRKVCADYPFGRGLPGRWKPVPVGGANGELAVAFHVRGEDGEFRPWGVHVLVLGAAGAGGLPPILEYHVFHAPGLVHHFSPSLP